VEALRKKERQDETQFTTCWMLMYFFAGDFFEAHPVYDQTQGDAVFFLLCG
jgi:hypothetical protein